MPHNLSTNSTERKHFYLCSLLNQQEPTDAHVILPVYTAIWVNCIIAGALMPPAVLGNGLILATICRTAALRTPPYVLLAGLAFTDLCTGLIIQPLHIMYMLSNLNDNQAVLCITGVLISILGTYVMFLTFGAMTLMSVERWFHMKRRTFFTLLRICGFYAILLCVPIPFIILYLWPSTNSTTNKQIARGAGVLFATVFFIITPLSYFKVLKIIRHHQQQVQSHQGSLPSSQPAINMSKYKRSVVTIFYLLVIFILGFTPLLIWLTLDNFINNDQAARYFLKYLSATIVLATSSLNPVICCCRMKDIRDGVKILLKKIFCRSVDTG